jgi:hypothetical protein
VRQYVWLTFLRREIRSKEREAIKANTVAAGLAERREILAKSIQDFREIQKVYIPGLAHLLENSDDSGLNARPELFKLMLPSQLSADNRDSWCLPAVSTLEARFRYAQADDALAEIRRLKRLYQGLSDQTKKHITTTQHTMPRGKGTFERYKTQISKFAAVYRHARRSLIALDPAGDLTQWTPRFLELKDSDIRGPAREGEGPPNGKTESSWIWQVPKPNPTPNPGTSTPDDPNFSARVNISEESQLSQRAADGEEVALSIRSHWAICQARAERYEEEVELTVEEMRRTVEFFNWRSQWWLSLADVRQNSPTPPDPQVQHGLRAYAHRQASMYSSFAAAYLKHWQQFLVDNSLGLDWLAQYPTESPLPAHSVPKNTDRPIDENDDEDGLESEAVVDLQFEERFSGMLGN